MLQNSQTTRSLARILLTHLNNEVFSLKDKRMSPKMTGGKRRKNKRRKMKMRTKISLTWINSCYDSVMIVDKIINFRMRRIQ
jgi:hypothetical protein